MFGRDLIEQVRSDDKGDGRMVPVIVEKCLEAVEAIGESTDSIHLSAKAYHAFLRPRL